MRDAHHPSVRAVGVRGTMRTQLVTLGALVTVLVLPISSTAQSADELAKHTQNPVASLISVPLQGNWDFGIGDRDATATLLNIQPVMPFAVTPSTNVILRIIMPMTSQPATDGTRINGLGDIVATAFFSPASRAASSGASAPSSCSRSRRTTHSAARNSASARSVVALHATGQLDDRRAVSIRSGQRVAPSIAATSA